MKSHLSGPVEERRLWTTIAEELCQESDPARVTELAEELNEALGQQSNCTHPRRKQTGHLARR